MFIVVFQSLYVNFLFGILSWQVKRRNSEESSTQWTTGIAEVQLPIEYAHFPFLLHWICIIIFLFSIICLAMFYISNATFVFYFP
jgi:hypothetical protein